MQKDSNVLISKQFCQALNQPFRKKKVSKNPRSPGCQTQAGGSNINTDWLSKNTTERFGLSILEQSSGANLGISRKNLCSSHRQALLTVQPELPLVSFTEWAVSEEVARPTHSAPAIVYHHSCQKNSLIFLRQVILEHNLQNNSKAAVYMLDTSWMHSHLKNKPSAYWGCRTLSLQRVDMGQAHW